MCVVTSRSEADPIVLGRIQECGKEIKKLRVSKTSDRIRLPFTVPLS
jgi:hypothetical protein